MSLARFVAQRLLSAVMFVLVVASIAFLLALVAPGQSGDEIGMRPEERAALRAELGLDQPLWVQYGRWLAGAGASRPRPFVAVSPPGDRSRRRASAQHRDPRHGRSAPWPPLIGIPARPLYRSGADVARAGGPRRLAGAAVVASAVRIAPAGAHRGGHRLAAGRRHDVGGQPWRRLGARRAAPSAGAGAGARAAAGRHAGAPAGARRWPRRPRSRSFVPAWPVGVRASARCGCTPGRSRSRRCSASTG